MAEESDLVFGANGILEETLFSSVCSFGLCVSDWSKCQSYWGWYVHMLNVQFIFLSKMKLACKKKKNSFISTCLHCISWQVIYFKLNWCLFVGKIFAGKSSNDSDFPSLTVAASKKVLVPGGQSDGSSPLTEQLEAPSTVSEDLQVYDAHFWHTCYVLCYQLWFCKSIPVSVWRFLDDEQKSHSSQFLFDILNQHNKLFLWFVIFV